MIEKVSLFSRIEGGLVVSCQALEDEPLHSAEIMARMAEAAMIGGAVGIRCNGVEDTKAIRAKVDLPVIGLWKVGREGVYITPTADHALSIINAGAEMVALDATKMRANLESDVLAIHKVGGLVMADISTYEEALMAADVGVDCISTTLSGYTEWSPQQEAPDFDLVNRLSNRLSIPVIAEGRINTPELLEEAFAVGAFAVVVGSAITRPQWITSNFIRRLPVKRNGAG
ncbi:MAG: N-acetylmannosamine-6-phosphate 2-epimerase [Verrucomicrobiota bacterium]|nr:N-acetylmannosamine-6-phosphate 2-epimerase [Verrucomicrobiota bacterium]